jgi:succinate dehydrogenase/fumarate reductase flavoprotein subunit
MPVQGQQDYTMAGVPTDEDSEWSQ